jgi:hypothetical protein
MDTLKKEFLFFVSATGQRQITGTMNLVKRSDLSLFMVPGPTGDTLPRVFAQN